jgi:hypothetical protein
MHYALTSGTVVIRYNDNGTTDSFGPGSMEWSDYLAWVAAGNTPDPYLAPVVVPFNVTPFQAKAALLAAGLLPAVEAAIAAASPIAQLAWTDATGFTRDSPTIAALSAQLGLTSAQVDDLFIAAASIEA